MATPPALPGAHWVRSPAQVLVVNAIVPLFQGTSILDDVEEFLGEMVGFGRSEGL